MALRAFLFRARGVAYVSAMTGIGTGEKTMILRYENHRVAMFGCVTGVHTPTAAMATRTNVIETRSARVRAAATRPPGRPLPEVAVPNSFLTE